MYFLSKTYLQLVRPKSPRDFLVYMDTFCFIVVNSDLLWLQIVNSLIII